MGLIKTVCATGKIPSTHGIGTASCSGVTSGGDCLMYHTRVILSVHVDVHLNPDSTIHLSNRNCLLGEWEQVEA